MPSKTKVIADESYAGIGAQEVVIPSGCTAIGAYAFGNYRALQMMEIPASVKSIAENAFSGTDATIVSPIGSYAITWAENNGVDYMPY